MVDASNKNQCPEGMVLIPHSKFMMGSGWFSPSAEKPRHEVEVSAFYYDKHSVTNRDYSAFEAGQKHEPQFELVATNCGTRAQSVVARGDNQRTLLAQYLGQRKRPENMCGLSVEANQTQTERPHYDGFNYDGFMGADQPAVGVDWNDADAYCKAQGKRLPTEAEREKAAIGPTKGYDTSVQYGTLSGQLNHDEAVYYPQEHTANVCSKPENGYGLCDMSGNVWEWVSDFYSSDYYKNSPAKDPQGPANDTGLRVMRGGSWFNDGYGLRAAYRRNGKPSYRGVNIGFRCAVSVFPEDSKK